MRLRAGKLRQKVLVNAPEHIARHFLKFFGVQFTEKLTENFIIQLVIFFFRQHTFQRFIILFNGLHRLDDRLRAVGGIRQSHKIIKLRFRAEKHRTLRRKIFLHKRTCFTASCR